MDGEGGEERGEGRDGGEEGGKGDEKEGREAGVILMALMLSAVS